MKKRPSIGALWKRALKWAALMFVFAGVSVVLYCWNLSSHIEKRFAGRRWSIPSGVFSDITLMYPGQRINRELFHQKLRRLGYREVSHMPDRKGELRNSPSGVELFLHELRVPTQKREGFPVKVNYVGSQIESIVRLEDGQELPILKLEPEELVSFFGPERERRRLVSINQVPQHLIYAILAAEDSRFYKHHGLDPKGILRALYTNISHGAIRQGGSTVTQQLAKSYFLTPERTLSRKLKELLMSLTMEVMFDKDEILEIYLNEIYLGQNASVSINGVGEASFFYFGKPVSELSLTEASTIASLVKAPNYYSPYVDRKRCQDRRNLILRSMQKNGWISDEELNASLPTPVNAVGFKLYDKKAPYFMDYLSQQLASLYSHEALSSLGLSIYTTLDTQVQMAAERALARGLARLEKSNLTLRRTEPEIRVQGAIVVIQPKTGYILAMVGGRNYNLSQFNRITQARRQPGSTFKPFVYLSGLDMFTPSTLLSNEPRSYDVNGKSWQPQNFEPLLEPRVSMRTALAKSINLATVDLAMNVGLDRLVRTTEAFGFSTSLKPYPSVSLGAFEVIPLELALAYCVFAADGMLPYPLSLKEVVDENGKILERRHMTIEHVTSPAKAFIISSMLRTAVTEGTARSLANMGVSFPVAGKTGTTNSLKDAWFVGYTPDILALVWVGFDDGSSIDASGSRAALPIWADLINSIPHCISGDWFKMPPGVVRQAVCSESGQRAIINSCPKTIEEVFLADNVPTGYCPIHRGLDPFKQLIKELKDFIKDF